MSYRYDPLELSEEESDANFLVRHWQGNYSLAQSYWLIGGLLSGMVINFVAGGIIYFQESSESLRTIAMLWIGFVILFVAIRIWAMVGIWRSAGKHHDRGGSKGWAAVARAILVIGLIVSLVQARNYGTAALEYGRLAMGRDSLGKDAVLTLAADGREIMLDGMITMGTADRFRRLLQASPKVGTVRLESAGGRILEATVMARLVRERRLDTRVEDHCESACTLVLLAGNSRLAQPSADIGFHQPDFPGMDDTDRRAMIAGNRDLYRTAGVDPAFIDRVMRTPPADMWYPAHSELVDAAVLNGAEIVVGGRPSEAPLGRATARFAAAVAATLPVRIDSHTQAVALTADGPHLQMTYALSKPIAPEMIATARGALQVNVAKALCGEPQIAKLIGAGADFTVRYQHAGATLFEFPVARCL